jgi:hypothetical protein
MMLIVMRIDGLTVFMCTAVVAADWASPMQHMSVARVSAHQSVDCSERHAGCDDHDFFFFLLRIVVVRDWRLFTNLLGLRHDRNW